jgi:hypothetical protein
MSFGGITGVVDAWMGIEVSPSHVNGSTFSGGELAGQIHLFAEGASASVALHSKQPSIYVEPADDLVTARGHFWLQEAIRSR